MLNQKNIDKIIYHSLYVLAKGNQFKNKRVLLGSIHEIKSVRSREMSLKEKAELRKGRARKRLEGKATREEKNITEKEAAGAGATTESLGVILTF